MAWSEEIWVDLLLAASLVPREEHMPEAAHMRQELSSES